tara:strand:+ start:8192 stop:8875 length:684 start_codon:yes stop_codon:yes gene_type:complete
MQSDYRDGIYDDDDNNINGVLSTITGQVPGVIGEYAKGVLKNTIKEFYKLSTAWREFVDIGPLSDAETPYQLNPLRDENIKAHSVIGLALDGYQLARYTIGSGAQYASSVSSTESAVPTAYWTEKRTEIHFFHKLASGSSPFVAQAIVVPTLASDELSDWALDSHGDAFIAGTLHKLHNEIGKTYTDPYKAMYYGKQWRYYINMHKIEADKNYGDAQHAWQYPRGTM